MQTGDTKIFEIRNRNGESKVTIFDVDNVRYDGRNNIFIVQTIFREKHYIPCTTDETYYTNAYILGEGRGRRYD